MVGSCGNVACAEMNKMISVVGKFPERMWKVGEFARSALLFVVLEHLCSTACSIACRKHFNETGDFMSKAGIRAARVILMKAPSYRDNGKEHGNYYSMLGLCRDNGKEPPPKGRHAFQLAVKVHIVIDKAVASAVSIQAIDASLSSPIWTL